MPTTVYFATNRKLTGDPSLVASYGPAIQPADDPSGLVYGTAFVDGIDVPSNTQGTITSIATTAIGGFPDDAMADLSAPGRNLLVFIHGFDNDFSDAITRAAFNREWLAEAAPGGSTDTTVIAFSWPSLGKIISLPILTGDYERDQGMAQLSGLHTMTFLSRLEPLLRAARGTGARAYLLAHSMGNLALANGVQAWFAHGNGTATLFDCAVLAAGDCRADAFDQPHMAQLAGLDAIAKRVSIYYSHADDVLKLSEAVNLGAQRLGQDGPTGRTDPTLFPPAEYRMVDATDFRGYDFTFLTSHQYYRSSPAARSAIATDMAI